MRRVAIGLISMASTLACAAASAQDMFHEEQLTPAQLPRYAAAADFDRDGDLDLALPNGTLNLVRIFLNTGDGTLVPHINVPGGGDAIGAADFDGDGHPDLIVTEHHGTGDSIVWHHRNRGDATFETVASFKIPAGAIALALGDFDSSGELDVAIACVFAADSLAVLLNDGTGGFHPPVTYSIPVPNNIFAAGFNGDGHADLVLSQGKLLYGSRFVVARCGVRRLGRPVPPPGAQRKVVRGHDECPLAAAAAPARPCDALQVVAPCASCRASIKWDSY